MSAHSKIKRTGSDVEPGAGGHEGQSGVPEVLRGYLR